MIAAADVVGLVTAIRDGHAGETVVVAGHSNTLPAIIAALGGPAGVEIADDDFDDLFVVTVPCGGDARVVRLRYGATSPSLR